MILDIVRIGNSQGIRIPKKILEQCGFEKQLDLEIEDNKLILTPVNPRKNWEQAFKEMHKNGDDKLLISDNLDLDSEEWEW